MTAENAMQEISTILNNAAATVVIKVGSALLVDEKTGTLNRQWLQSLAADIAALHKRGIQCLIVSSGSIALGRSKLGLSSRPVKLEEAQAAAAIGQVQLAEAYSQTLGDHGLIAAQMLLTLHDLEDRPRYLNARGTLEALLDNNIIPVINENDSVATSEIRFGDNDRLAARVGALAKADVVILLSDIEGLYTANPKTNREASFIDRVDTITSAIEAMAGPENSDADSVGTGGMITKIMAAKIATKAGCSLIIAKGTALHPIKELEKGARHTLFTAKESPLDVRKQWIHGLQSPAGSVHIDAGAVEALQKGRSLLPVGVTHVKGDFQRGDLITVIGPDNRRLGQGFINFHSQDAGKIKGCTSAAITAMIGPVSRTTLIHRDDMVLF